MGLSSCAQRAQKSVFVTLEFAHKVPGVVECGHCGPRFYGEVSDRSPRSVFGGGTHSSAMTVDFEVNAIAGPTCERCRAGAETLKMES